MYDAELIKEVLSGHPTLEVSYVGELPAPDPTDPYWIENPLGTGVIFKGRFEVEFDEETTARPAVIIPVSPDLLEKHPYILRDILLPQAEEKLQELVSQASL